VPTLLHYVIDPLKKVLFVIINYLPKIFLIFIIMIITKYILRFTKFIFNEISKGSIQINGEIGMSFSEELFHMSKRLRELREAREDLTALRPSRRQGTTPNFRPVPDQMISEHRPVAQHRISNYIWIPSVVQLKNILEFIFNKLSGFSEELVERIFSTNVWYNNGTKMKLNTGFRGSTIW
jgi:hypothetical protein